LSGPIGGFRQDRTFTEDEVNDRPWVSPAFKKNSNGKRNDDGRNANKQSNEGYPACKPTIPILNPIRKPRG
jgi:hypothetical protein